MSSRYAEVEILDSRIREITPLIAEEMLKNNLSNRSIRGHIVEEYAKAMASGNWITTHQGIAINSMGNIIDGQHRLMAIVKSKTTVRLMTTIYAGSESATRIPLDLQSRRMMHDICGISRYDSEIINFINGSLTETGTRSDPTKVMEMNEYLDTHLLWAEKALFKTTVKRLSTASVRSAIVVAHIAGYDYSNEYNILVSQRYEFMNSNLAYLSRHLCSMKARADGKEIFGKVWIATVEGKKSYTDERINSAIERAKQLIKGIMR